MALPFPQIPKINLPADPSANGTGHGWKSGLGAAGVELCAPYRLGREISVSGKPAFPRLLCEPPSSTEKLLHLPFPINDQRCSAGAAWG